jgi:hypothetical protein
MSRPATDRLKVNAPLGSPPTLEWRAVGELGVDEAYQRSTALAASVSLIRRIAQYWDWGLCQPLAVARRPDGSLMVVDGQHRLAAAKLRRDIAHLPCVITAFANQGDEAAAFVALNQQRRPLSNLDLFKAALAAGDTTAKAIVAAMTKAGLTLAGHSNYTVWKPGLVANIGGIQMAWRYHGEKVVGPSLTILERAFSGQIMRYAGTIFPGIVGCLAAYEEARTEEGIGRMAAMLALHSQVEWRRLILTHVGETGMRRSKASADIISRKWEALECRLAPAKPVVPETAPPATFLLPAETAWCEQCDQRVSGARAERCASPFCSLKAKAA